MNDKQRTQISKFMSLVLRHEPHAIGAELDADGWMPVDVLLNGMRKSHPNLTLDDLIEIVESNEKKRFQLSECRKNIRAVQGHSVAIEGSTVKPELAPEFLYHGTATKSVEAILANGLIPMSRIHVHLSSDIETATKVGSRHGKPVIFQVNSKVAQNEGIQFFQAENGVWLCDALPAKYLTLMS
jgi:putative RNA 2'-phosphotransferase